MRDYEIPESDWVNYFDQFSRVHAGWPATIEVLMKLSGPQRLADGLALQGISFEKSGSRPCTIQVGVGDNPSANIAHVIDLPMRIREVDDEARGELTIQIEPAQGPPTLVHVHPPA